MQLAQQAPPPQLSFGLFESMQNLYSMTIPGLSIPGTGPLKERTQNRGRNFATYRRPNKVDQQLKAIRSDLSAHTLDKFELNDEVQKPKPLKKAKTGLINIGYQQDWIDQIWQGEFDAYSEEKSAQAWQCPELPSSHAGIKDQLMSLMNTNSITEWTSERGQKIEEWVDKKYSQDRPEDCFKNFFELAQGYGFTPECHSVVTEDGYVLNVFRLKDPRTPPNAPVAFMQHGIMTSAENWVVNGDASPAFTLARAGYDVWLGNSRGSKYSRQHKTLDPNHDQEYWQFSWEEMGVKDLPAAIDFVREQTGQEKVTYIGHSQGTTQMFVALGLNEEFWKERINLFVATAPVLIPNRDSKLFKSSAKLEPVLEKVLAASGIYELGGQDWDSVQKTVLAIIPALQDLFLGYLTKQERYNDPDFTKIFAAHFPQGSSVRQVTHYGQIISSKQFQRFDFGSKEKNLEHYNQEKPPKIDLENIKDVPIAMFSAIEDKIVSIEENRKRADSIPAVFRHEELDADHITFLVGKNMDYMNTVLDLMKDKNPLNYDYKTQFGKSDDISS